mmetsp:Transcript_286/g.560  ORF Transcript_286/g.560 Transcript_286/m.560 type:complete len:102 (+) Transcript_286:239-544(+)
MKAAMGPWSTREPLNDEVLPQAQTHPHFWRRNVWQGLPGTPIRQHYRNRDTRRLRLGSFNAATALRSATSSAGEFLSWCTGMNPYKDSALGVLSERVHMLI